MHSFIAWFSRRKLLIVSSITLSTLLVVFVYFAGKARAAVTEKFTNTGFNSDLSGWTAAQSYTLDDEFSDTQLTDHINGTFATDGINVRKVTDTGHFLSVIPGYLSVSGGTPVNYGDPGLWYPAIPRTVGGIATFQVTTGASLNSFLVALNSSNTGLGVGSGYGGDGVNFSVSGSLRIVDNSGFSASAATYATNTDYKIALVTRSKGSYFFIKGGAFTDWTLLWYSAFNNLTGLYPEIGGYNLAATSDFVRLPSSTWLPTPLAYDSFGTTGLDTNFSATETTGPDGSSSPAQLVPSVAWNGSTWSVSGEAAINTPVPGAEILTNGAFTTFTGTKNDGVQDTFTGWSTTNGGNGDIVEAIDGADARNGISARMTNGNPAVGNRPNTGIVPAATNGNWYQTSVWAKSDATTTTYFTQLKGLVNQLAQSDILNSTTYNQIIGTGRCTGTSITWSLYSSGNANAPAGKIYWDDASVKAIPHSSLFSNVQTSTKDVFASVNITEPLLAVQAGIATNLNSTSSAGLVAYIMRTNSGTGAASVILDQFTSPTTWTNIIPATAVTYVAGAPLRITTFHSDANTMLVRVFYNNAIVNSEKTITDSAVINNTYHGLFSTYPSSTFDNFTILPRGTGGEYSALSPADPTATLVSTPTFAGSSGSIKVVASTNDARLYQNVNIGDVSTTYNLSAYVYTNGSSVSSNDAQLEVNGSTISTNYASGGNGWYQLTGTITGTNTSIPYGVRIKAGKTVYVDNVSLSVGTPDSSSTSSCTDAAPGTPSITSLVAGTNNIKINFTKPSGTITYYSLEYGTESGKYIYGVSNLGGSSITSYTVNGLTSGKAYYFKVKAGNSCNSGSWSGEVSAKTPGTTTTTTVAAPASTAKPVATATAKATAAPTATPKATVKPIPTPNTVVLRVMGKELQTVFGQGVSTISKSFTYYKSVFGRWFGFGNSKVKGASTSVYTDGSPFLSTIFRIINGW